MKVNLTCSGQTGKLMVWQTSREALDPKCTVPIVKPGGGNVKCWSCMSSSSLGNLAFIDESMIEQVYRNTLQKNLFDSVKNLNLGGK